MKKTKHTPGPWTDLCDDEMRDLAGRLIKLGEDNERLRQGNTELLEALERVTEVLRAARETYTLYAFDNAIKDAEAAIVRAKGEEVDQ